MIIIFFIVGPLFASSLLNRLHIMMVTMLIVTLLTLIAIFIVVKRLRPSSEKTSSDDIEETDNHNHNHSLSLRNDTNESALVLPSPSKNSYVTLVQHDDGQTDDFSNKNSKHDSLTKRSSNKISNGDI